MPLRWDGRVHRGVVRFDRPGAYRWTVEADPYSARDVVPVTDIVLCADGAEAGAEGSAEA